MRNVIIAGVVTALISSPALACPPPIAGQVEPPPPTHEETAKSIARSAANIVYGQIVSDFNEPIRFKVLHVYQGSLKPGFTLNPVNSWGFNPPPCHGMLSLPPPPPGAYGVIAFGAEPELRWIPDPVLQSMFEQRLITSARSAR